MSTESEFDLDKLFLPAWAQESPSYNKYAGHTGEDKGPRGRDRDRDDRRGPRRPMMRRDEGGAPQRGPRRDGGQFQGRGPRRDDRGPRVQRDDRRGGPRDFRERREFVPLPEITVTLMPDEKGVESLARQIKMTGRAYPLFEIAKLILQKPERQQVRFDVVKKEDKVVQPLFLCMLDDTVWLSGDEAVQHVLSRHFDTFYKAERTPTDPPKGVFTFVAQCGMSGTVLGPPNYHDYQIKLRKLHQEQFSRMPFEAFKARVKIVRDEAVVKKWLEDQSWKTEYITLNVPETEARNLPSREEVQRHFRHAHMTNIIKEVESHTLSGPASRRQPCPQLQRLVRRAWEEQQRFPLKVVHYLSQEFATRGLQFFKVNKQVTHVAVARPHYLDIDATPVSDTIRRIIECINQHPKCTRRELIETLTPSPASTPTPAEGEPAPKTSEPTEEQKAIIADLHWLVHQGHVIEFANGILEAAKKPRPRPEPKKAAATESAPAQSESAAEPVGVTEPAVQSAEAAGEPSTATSEAVPDFSAQEIADLEQSAEVAEPTTESEPSEKQA